MWRGIHEDILEQCDELGGARHGIIEVPSRCKCNPERLLCGASELELRLCLTASQVSIIRGVYANLIVEGDTLIYPGLQPGSELETLGWGTLSRERHSLVEDWFRYAVYDDPTWDVLSIGPGGFRYAKGKDAGKAHGWRGGLSAFTATGSKILVYHGAQDGLIPSKIANIYREHVSKTMNETSAELDDFYRRFQVDGMNHSTLGPGAWYVGQPGFNLIRQSPEKHVLMAMVKWVKEGDGPEYLRGAK